MSLIKISRKRVLKIFSEYNKDLFDNIYYEDDKGSYHKFLDEKWCFDASVDERDLFESSSFFKRKFYEYKKDEGYKFITKEIKIIDDEFKVENFQIGDEIYYYEIKTGGLINKFKIVIDQINSGRVLISVDNRIFNPYDIFEIKDDTINEFFKEFLKNYKVVKILREVYNSKEDF